MDFIDRSLVIVDLETTGLDPLVHEVIDIGAVRVDQASLDIEATFSARLRRPISNWRIRSHFRSTAIPLRVGAMR